MTNEQNDQRLDFMKKNSELGFMVANLQQQFDMTACHLRAIIRLGGSGSIPDGHAIDGMVLHAQDALEDILYRLLAEDFGELLRMAKSLSRRISSIQKSMRFLTGI